MSEHVPASAGVVPYLMSRSAAEAIAFYKRAFGAEELERQQDDTGKRVMHCHLRINGGSLMVCDCFPEYGHPWKEPQGTTLTMQVDDIDMWWKRAVDAGCVVTMPLQKQFWGDRYGALVDPFGHAWAMNAPG